MRVINTKESYKLFSFKFHKQDQKFSRKINHNLYSNMHFKLRELTSKVMVFIAKLLI